MSRNFMHFPDAGVSLGIDEKKGQARISVAIVNREAGDRFSRRAARTLLDARLDGQTQTLKAFRVNQHLFTMPYDGTQSVNDVLRPLASKMRDQLELRKDGRGNAQSLLRIISRECQRIRSGENSSYAVAAVAMEDD